MDIECGGMRCALDNKTLLTYYHHRDGGHLFLDSEYSLLAERSLSVIIQLSHGGHNDRTIQIIKNPLKYDASSKHLQDSPEF